MMMGSSLMVPTDVERERIETFCLNDTALVDWERDRRGFDDREDPSENLSPDRVFNGLALDIGSSAVSGLGTFCLRLLAGLSFDVVAMTVARVEGIDGADGCDCE